MDIVAYVSEKTGLSHEMSAAAVGLLLQFAKAKFGDKFDMVAQYIPGANELMEKAPSGGLMGSIGEMASSMFGGGGEDSLANLASKLTGAGVPPEKIPEAADAVVDYLGEQGGEEQVKSLLAEIFPTSEN